MTNKMTDIKKIIRQSAKAIIVVSLVIVYFNWLPKTLFFFVKGWFVFLIFHFLWRTLYRREHSLQSAKALFITICLAIVIYYWYSLPKTLILFAAGCLVYLIFRFLWRNLYRLGHNRIFILGIFALLPIFIIAFIVQPGDMRQWHLYIGKYITNFPYFTSYFDSNVKQVNGWLWLWHKADKYMLPPAIERFHFCDAEKFDFATAVNIKTFSQERRLMAEHSICQPGLPFPQGLSSFYGFFLH